MAFDATGIRVFVALRHERGESSTLLGVAQNETNAKELCEASARRGLEWGIGADGPQADGGAFYYEVLPSELD